MFRKNVLKCIGLFLWGILSGAVRLIRSFKWDI